MIDLMKLLLKKCCGYGLFFFWVIAIVAIFTAYRVEAQEVGSTYEEKMIASGLVDITSIDSTILVDMKYSCNDNFTGEDLYGVFDKAYLLPHIAHKLRKAGELLRSEGYSNLRIIIYDAARPQSAQYRMYNKVKGTPQSVYVAHPVKGGRHNFGVAVDLSLWDIQQGKALDMGTAFDFFGIESHVGEESKLVKRGLISKEAQKNRELLIRIMRSVGLHPYHREWWHYEEAISMIEVRQKYRLLAF